MIPYEDWVAYKEPGELILNILLEPKNDSHVNQEDIAKLIWERLIEPDVVNDQNVITMQVDMANMLDFKVKVTLLPRGAFHNYMYQRQLEGADLAHLKPPHVNPSHTIISMLQTQLKADEVNIKKEKVRI
jgi:hypothetical protein